MLNNILIVLVSTSHPGNIGSTARAMKTMGITNLSLVNPREFPSSHANALACGADDILEQAVVCDTLGQAVAKCKFIIAASARVRRLTVPIFVANNAASEILNEAKQHQVAIVFGREDAGLTNEELELCHAQLHIPTNPHFTSLNLSAAVQVICYELRIKIDSMPTKPQSKINSELAETEQVQFFYQQLQEVLIKIQFLKSEHQQKIMHKFKQLYNRSRLTVNEVAMLRGFLTKIADQLAKIP